MDKYINEELLDSRLLGLDDKGRLDPLNYASVFAQTTNVNARTGSDISKRTLSSIYLTLCLRFTDFFAGFQNFVSSESLDNGKNEDLLSDLEMKIGGLILRHLQSTSCNAYEMNAVSVGSDRRKLEIIPVGGATYPTVSITNHSCSPNVYRFNIDKLSVVKAIMDIPEGEQILDTYGESFTTESKLDRQRRLVTQYFFECSCPPCQEDWPRYHELPPTKPTSMTRVPCLSCGATHLKDRQKCTKCGKKVDGRQVERDLKLSQMNYVAKKDSLISGASITSDMESAFSSHISFLQKLQSAPCPDKLIVECQEALKLVWNLAGA